MCVNIFVLNNTENINIYYDGGVNYMSDQVPKLRLTNQSISSASKTVGRHRHREPEMLLVTSGELRALLNNREIVLHEGEGLFINSGAVHGVIANTKEGANFLSISFDVECITGSEDTRLVARYIDPLLNARNFEYIPLHGSGWANDICDIMRSMQATYSSKMPGYELKLKIKLSEIWLTLYENCIPDIGDKHGVSHTEKARIDVLRRFIQENYAEKITLEDIAAAAHISRGECCRIFKRLYNTTPFQYLVHYRLTRSAYYLSETDKSISQIAQSVGFCSSSYYTKCFRTEYNCTPLKFRQAQHRLAGI
jgi:AraC family transcriptional regulator, melibiose operon regulatory protein